MVVFQRRLQSAASKYTHARSPTLPTWIDHDLIWKRIRFACGDRRDMILIAVHDSDNLEGGLLQHHFHGLANFDTFAFCSGRCQCDVQRPQLPAYLLFPFGTKPGLSPAFFEELNGDLAADTIRGQVGGGVYLPNKSTGTLIYQCLQLRIVDDRKREVKEVACLGPYGWEEAVEEYRM